MGNVFLKYQGLEFFGTFETARGRNWFEPDTRNMNQVAGEILYRFGKQESIYLGARYNQVVSDLTQTQEVNINRFQVGAGWFVIPNILFKSEYVNQNYNDFPTGDLRYEGNFKGFMIEAVVGF